MSSTPGLHGFSRHFWTHTNVNSYIIENNHREVLVCVHPLLRLQKSVALPKGMFSFEALHKTASYNNGTSCNLGWKPKKINIRKKTRKSIRKRIGFG